MEEERDQKQNLCFCGKESDIHKSSCPLFVLVSKKISKTKNLSIRLRRGRKQCDHCGKRNSMVASCVVDLPTCRSCFESSRTIKNSPAQNLKKIKKDSKAGPKKKTETSEDSTKIITDHLPSRSSGKNGCKYSKTLAYEQNHKLFELKPTLETCDQQPNELETFTWSEIEAKLFTLVDLSVLDSLMLKELPIELMKPVVVNFSPEGLQTPLFFKTIYKQFFMIWKVDQSKESYDELLTLQLAFPVSRLDIEYILSLQREISYNPEFDYGEFITNQLENLRSVIKNQIHKLKNRVLSSLTSSNLSDIDSSIIKSKLSYLKLMKFLHGFSNNFKRYHQVDKDYTHLITYLSQKGETKEPECAICMNILNTNGIMYCGKCDQGAHPECLGIKELSQTDDFICDGCSQTSNIQLRVCIICKQFRHMLIPLQANSIFKVHVFCLVMSKNWDKISAERSKLKNYNLRNHINCSLCKPPFQNKGEVIRCIDCPTDFHALCGYLHGCHFEIEDESLMTFDSFTSNQFSYKVKAKCNKCTKIYLTKLDFQSENSSPLTQNLQEANAYYRNVIIDPSFMKRYKTFEDFLKSYKT